MSALPTRAQASVLTARYAATLRGDALTVLLLVAQAPLIGWLCVVVWGSIEEDTPTLWFVMCLSALWFGCIGACREIVKERAILERERFFGLSMGAYVASKLAVLGGVGLVQVMGLQIVIESSLSLRGPYLLQTLALWGAALCGTGLGLLVSALSRAQERAVGVVPLIILPQILFSELAIPRDTFSDAVALIEKLMPVRWAYRVFQESAEGEPDWLIAGADLAVLPLYATLLCAAAVIALRLRRIET